MRRGLLLIAAVALSISCRGRDAWAIPPPPPLVAWTDPFYEGFAAQLTLKDREGDTETVRDLILDAAYAWDNGLALTLEVPSVIADSTADSGAVPRIGGNPTDHIETAASFRLWGDAYDYFAVSMGVGLPIASNDAQRNATGTIFLLSAFGQYDWGWGAFQFRFIDDPTLPSVNLTDASSTQYNDESNFIQYSVTLLFYPSSRFGPYLTWVESLPRETNIGNEFASGIGDVFGARTVTNRVRHLGLGFEVAPFSAQTVLSVEGDKFSGWGADVTGVPDWQVQGSVRWAF